MIGCSAFRRGWRAGAPEDHAAVCAGCAEWLAGQRRAAAALAHLALGLDRSVLPRDDEAALRAAFRQAQRPAPAPRPWHWTWTLAAAAAVVVLVVGLVLARVLPAPPGRAATSAPAPVKNDGEQVAAARAPARPSAAAPALQPRAVRRARRVAPKTDERPLEAVQPAPAGIAIAPPEMDATEVPPRTADTVPPPPAAVVPGEVVQAPVQSAEVDERGFQPLPGAEGDELDSGQIVRVQLRADVLDAAGLPSRAGAQGPVEADVLVGPDGVARGIRLARPPR